MLCCSTRYNAEQAIKSTVTNDLCKSREVCFRAELPFRVLNPGDMDGAGGSHQCWPRASGEGSPWAEMVMGTS